ncbi:pentapeptide repeat-containing protein [Saccharothrix sp. Mg75]|uniref:pentapeptide repeat-containing protein n=1 Tax=Saccharothrix sp. Mg75 TaxID=3445357 RepID=UPI003EEE2202
MDSLQVSRAVLGSPRASRVRRALTAVLLVAAVVSVAPGWWAGAVVSAARHVVRFWPTVVLALAAVASVVGGRRRTVRMTLGRRPRAPGIPLSVHVVLLLASAVAVTGVVGLLLWGVLGGSPVGAPGQSPPPGASAGWSVQDRLDAVKVVLAVVGGLGAVVALAVAYRRQRLNEVEVYREDAKVLLDRFGKAAELLGAPGAAVRTAGVYALAALANDAPEGRQGCIDVLCAYLRQQPWSPTSGAGVAHDALPAARDEERTTGQERQVRLAVIRLIRDNLHLPDNDPRTWRGHDFDFTGAVLDGGDFAGATFTGAGLVTFADATIIGRLSFDGATFAGGTVSFDGARFVGGGISLNDAVFAGGVVDLSRVDPAQPPEIHGLRSPATPPPTGLRAPGGQEFHSPVIST